MTLPIERSRSIRHAREFLLDLMDPKKTPKVPKEVRERAYSILRHFPGDHYINCAADGSSEFDHLEKKNVPFEGYDIGVPIVIMKGKKKTTSKKV